MRTMGWVVKSKRTGVYFATDNPWKSYWVDSRAEARVFLTKFEAFAEQAAFWKQYGKARHRDVVVVRLTARSR